ncbi:MAG: efflux RND transporter periplasmic adaptor subunit [Gammaproteobacteria bacterium]
MQHSSRSSITRRRLLCALAVGLGPVWGITGSQAAIAADTEIVALTPAQRQALAIEVTPAAPAASIAIEKLLGSVTLPLAGTTVIASPYAGRIARLRIDEGERVTQGQLLAMVDSRDFADERARLAEFDSRAHVAHQQAARDRLLVQEGILARARAMESAATAQQLDAIRRALAANLGAVTAAGADGTFASFELRAPHDGIVVKRHVLTGERIGALAPVFVLATSTAWRIEVHVPVALIPRLDDAARLRIGALEVPITGRGLALDEQTQTVIVRGVLPPNSGYVPGQQVIASLHLPAPPGAVQIPRSALMHGPDGASLFVRSEGGFRPLAVIVLSENPEVAVIEGAVAAGDAVVSKGTGALKSLLER